MSLLPFKDLPVHAGRKFVPNQIDLGNWGEVEPLFDRLEARIGKVQTAGELEQWLLD